MLMRTSAAVALALLGMATSGEAQTSDAWLTERARTAAVTAAERLPATVPRAVVKSLSVQGEVIRIDLGREVLAQDMHEIEDTLDPLLTAVENVTAGVLPRVEFQVSVEGVPLDRIVKRSAADSEAPEAQAASGVALPGRRVGLSAGHGWYRDEATHTWKLQRPYLWSIVEDFVNAEMTLQTASQLTARGLDVFSARYPSKSGFPGESGNPPWQEAALYNVKNNIGAPSSVWNAAARAYDSDILTRPLYANWVGAELLLSVHNNGGGGTGTEVWFDSSNGQSPGSERLARLVQRRVVDAIRARYSASWTDRGLKSCNGCKGENRLATRPAVIVEVAFMDTRTPDNDALRDGAFHRLVAGALADAVQEFLGAPVPLPTPSLTIDGTTSSTRAQGTTFSLAAWNLTAGRGVTRWLRQPSGQVITMTPPMTADGSGRVQWQFTPVCTSATGSYTVWVSDDATGRSSNAVVETIVRGPSCP